MTPIKRQSINKLADQIRTRLEIEVPADLDSLVARLAGKVEIVPSEELNEMEAAVEKTGDRAFVIRISDETPAMRRRFSIAHELGHLFLHMGYLVNPGLWAKTDAYRDSVRYRFGYTEEELEANEFAAALLMPSAEFRRIAELNCALGRYQVQPIAERFKVSTNAAKVRGQWLGLFSWDE